MRKLLPALLLACIPAFFGCTKKLTHFYIDYTTEITVPATLTTAFPFSLQTPPVGTNSTFEFEDHDTRKDKIQSIFLKELKLTIQDPSGETFSFVNSVSLYISTDDLPEVLVAKSDSVPDNIGDVLSLTPSDTDLQEYIKATKYRLRLKIISDETVPQDIHIEAYSNFLVDARLIRKKK
jgi:hypothetical protein